MPRNGKGNVDMRQVVANKYKGLQLGGEHGKMSWSLADANLLKAAVVAVTEDGAGLLLARTSDGGALCVQVWEGGIPSKLFPATELELTEALQLVIETAST